MAEAQPSPQEKVNAFKDCVRFCTGEIRNDVDRGRCIDGCAKVAGLAAGLDDVVAAASSGVERALLIREEPDLVEGAVTIGYIFTPRFPRHGSELRGEHDLETTSQ